MKKLVLALCAAISTNAFAEVNPNQYTYDVYILQEKDGKSKALETFSINGLQNEPISFVHEKNDSKNIQCDNKNKVNKSLKDGSKLTIELPQPNLKSGVSILILPEIESDQKVKIDAYISVSKVSFKNYQDKNGCHIPLYNVETTQSRIIENINIGKYHILPLGEKYDLAIKIEKNKK